MEFTGSDIQPHQVFNELDKFGLLLGLERLPQESNIIYKKRLLDVFTHRANSTTQGLVYGITRELGLEIEQKLLIKPTGDDTKVGLSIKGTKLCVYSDYYNKEFLDIGGVDQEYDLWNLDGNAYTLQEVMNIINGNASIPFLATHLGSDLSERSSTLLECSTSSDALTESLSGKGTVISLDNDAVVEGSEYFFPSRFEKVNTASEVTEAHHYHLDYLSGTITTFVILPRDAYIRYNYRIKELYVESSPVIIGNLQSEDLREKMFVQVEQPNDEPAVDGRPTHFGADIINELLSVHPLTFNK